MGDIILANLHNYKKIEEEQKYEFTIYVLETLGIPVEKCFPNEGYSKFTTKDKIKLRDILYEYNIEIIDLLNGELKIYVEKNLVAHWKKSFFKLKRDYSELKKEKQLYIEIHTNYWTIF